MQPVLRVNQEQRAKLEPAGDAGTTLSLREGSRTWRSGPDSGIYLRLWGQEERLRLIFGPILLVIRYWGDSAPSLPRFLLFPARLALCEGACISLLFLLSLEEGRSLSCHLVLLLSHRICPEDKGCRLAGAGLRQSH